MIISGQAHHRLAGHAKSSLLEPGSYFGSKGDVAHSISCAAGSDCVVYVRTEGRYELTGARPGE